MKNVILNISEPICNGYEGNYPFGGEPYCLLCKVDYQSV